MWIFCCGMPRSGSTVHYQLTADLVETQGIGKRVGYVDPLSLEALESLKNEESDDKLLVVKCHNYSEQAAELISSGKGKAIYVYRDIRDAMVSYMNRCSISFEKAMRLDGGFVETTLSSYYKWNSVDTILVSQYEDMVDNLKEEVIKIAEFLGLRITDEIAMSLARKHTLIQEFQHIRHFDYEQEGTQINNTHWEGSYDPKTQLHQNHIRSGKQQQWKYFLSNYQLLQVEAIAHEWLKERGYPLSQEMNELSRCEFLLNRTQDDLASYQAKFRKSHNEIVQLRTLIEKSHGELEQSQSQLHQTQGELEQSQSQLHQTQGELEQSQSQLHQTQGELEQSQSQLHQTRGELEQSQSQLHQTQGELEQSQSQLQSTQGELEQSQSQLHQTQGELEQSQSQLHQTQGELEQSQSQLHQTQGELEQSQSQLHQTRGELEQYRECLGQTEKIVEQYQSQLQQTKAELQQSKSMLYQKDWELESSRFQNYKAQAELAPKQPQIDKIKAELDQTQAELEQLKAQFSLTQVELVRTQLQQQYITTEPQLENTLHYKLLVWDAWYAYQNGNLKKMQQCLQDSLKFTSISRTESLLKWLESFCQFSAEKGQPFDTYALTNSKEWKKLMVQQRVILSQG